VLRADSASSRAASWLLGVSALVTTAASAAGAVPASEKQRTFRAGVVLLTIDVQITPSKDAPLRELAPADFEVTISGRTRPVTSAVLLHLDEASVVKNQPRPGQSADAGCIFGFHRKTDQRTAHYLLGIQRADIDRATKEVRVKTADPALATQWIVWRLPIR
jgi:hypothetical protein